MLAARAVGRLGSFGQGLSEEQEEGGSSSSRSSSSGSMATEAAMQAAREEAHRAKNCAAAAKRDKAARDKDVVHLTERVERWGLAEGQDTGAQECYAKGGCMRGSTWVQHRWSEVCSC